MNPRRVGIKGRLVVVIYALDLTVGPHVLHASVKGTRHPSDGGELAVLCKGIGLVGREELRGVEIQESRSVAETRVIVAGAKVQQEGRRQGAVVVEPLNPAGNAIAPVPANLKRQAIRALRKANGNLILKIGLLIIEGQLVPARDTMIDLKRRNDRVALAGDRPE